MSGTVIDGDRSWKAAFLNPDWEAEDALLYCGDCRKILPKLPDKCVDAVVTDPPYGIGQDKRAHRNSGKKWGEAYNRIYADTQWDNAPPTLETIALLCSIAPQAILWGGNFFDVPPSSCWLVWDKENGQCDQADCELAWTNLGGAVRLFSYRWHGMWRPRGEPRGDHPTQKPVGLMRWCLGFVIGSVLDPYMGSGTTGVACIQTGRRFVGIEIEPKYFDISVKRIERAIREDAGKFAFAKAKAPDPQMELIPRDQ